MKAAIVLSMNNASIGQDVGVINALLDTIAKRLTHVELWLFYTGTLPEGFPKISSSLAAIRLATPAHDHLPESYLHLLTHLTDQYPMDLILFPGDGWGKELATRLAYRLKAGSCLQVEKCCLASDKIEVIKSAYGNNLRARFTLEYPPFCLSLARQACPSAKMIPFDHLNKKIITGTPMQDNLPEEIFTIPDRSDNKLMDADLVLAVGQGAKNKETVGVLQGIATAIGAEFGASRPVVMNAWTDMERLIGSSGLILSPKLCIAAGISGSAVFTEGIKASDFIVAINTDRKAPVFQIAHVGIVGDIQAVLLELEKIIMAEKEEKANHKDHDSGLKG